MCVNQSLWDSLSEATCVRKNAEVMQSRANVRQQYSGTRNSMGTQPEPTMHWCWEYGDGQKEQCTQNWSHALTPRQCFWSVYRTWCMQGPSSLCMSSHTCIHFWHALFLSLCSPWLTCIGIDRLYKAHWFLNIVINQDCSIFCLSPHGEGDPLCTSVCYCGLNILYINTVIQSKKTWNREQFVPQEGIEDSTEAELKLNEAWTQLVIWFIVIFISCPDVVLGKQIIYLDMFQCKAELSHRLNGAVFIIIILGRIQDNVCLIWKKAHSFPLS